MLGNLFQQLLDAKHLEDQLIGTELFEDVSLTEGGDHRAVQALPWDMVQTLELGRFKWCIFAKSYFSKLVIDILKFIQKLFVF